MSDRYDSFYRDYWKTTGWNPAVGRISKTIADVFNQYIDKSKKIIDLGCGDGTHYGRFVSQLAGSYIGLDVSGEAVKKAKENGLEARKHNFNDRMPFDNNSFDVIICLEVIEHLFDPEFFLKECGRILKPAGFLILSLPNSFYLRQRIKFLSGSFSSMTGSPLAADKEWSAPHIRFFSKDSICRLLSISGFTISKFLPEGFYFLEALPFMGKLHRITLLNRVLFPFSRYISSLFPSLFSSGFLIVAGKTQKSDND
ncbi:MAG: class I SAM-dependent methyltransferase [Elusimicrobia bacterium]|nr:class I SAM-dependent methyltransferase [Elusimicrobiota bacterium]